MSFLDFTLQENTLYLTLLGTAKVTVAKVNNYVTGRWVTKHKFVFSHFVCDRQTGHKDIFISVKFFKNKLTCIHKIQKIEEPNYKP